MSTIQTATETLILLAKQAIHPDTVLVFADDLFEVQSTPSVVLQGPKLTEDRFRRSHTLLFEKDTDDLSFEECRFPRLYHLDFDLVLTGGSRGRTAPIPRSCFALLRKGVKRKGV